MRAALEVKMTKCKNLLVRKETKRNTCILFSVYDPHTGVIAVIAGKSIGEHMSLSLVTTNCSSASFIFQHILNSTSFEHQHCLEVLVVHDAYTDVLQCTILPCSDQNVFFVFWSFACGCDRAMSLVLGDFFYVEHVVVQTFALLCGSDRLRFTSDSCPCRTDVSGQHPQSVCPVPAAIYRRSHLALDTASC